MGYLILLRHAASTWNEKNIFTGWVDVALSETGVYQALDIRKIIANYPIDYIYTSKLLRAQQTAALAMLNHPCGKDIVVKHPNTALETFQSYPTIPMIIDEALNERCYGTLQGMNKKEAQTIYGKEQIAIWRRSYDQAPPQGESLEITAQRVLPYFWNSIHPHIVKGHTVLLCAHGNVLRAIVMELNKLSKEEISSLEIEPAKALIYRWDQGYSQ